RSRGERRLGIQSRDNEPDRSLGGTRFKEGMDDSSADRRPPGVASPPTLHSAARNNSALMANAWGEANGGVLMKALLCTHYGPPEEMELLEMPWPAPGKDQVLIAVKACGVNFPDVLMLADKYQFRPPLPFPPGGEVAGVVKALGEGADALKVGDRVAASIGHGGFAEEVLADVRRCLPIPANVDFDVASPFIVTYGTSYHALRDRARLKPGEHLVVLGAAGGVGSAAVELGVAMGAKVIAGASTQEKVDHAIKH